MTELRQFAAHVLALPTPQHKVHALRQKPLPTHIDVDLQLQATPCRPHKPILVHPRHVPTRKLNTSEGRAMLLHALAHIEFNAIHLALDMAVRFANMPAQFYADWVNVAAEEALHFELLCQRMQHYGVVYGDFPAHDGLWQMAEKTQHDVLARLGLVPRLLEARGLDVSPAIRDKLKLAGDEDSAKILSIILQDEIGHVFIGNYWYHDECARRKLCPITTFQKLLDQHSVASPRPPFNHEARSKAGFTAQEMAWLHQLEVANSHTN